MRWPLCLCFALAALPACSNTSSEVTDAARAGDAGPDARIDLVDARAEDSGADANAALDSGAPSDANAPDAGGCMASGACDPFDPSSCGTMACRPGASGTACMSVSATSVGVGMACPRPADCAPGLVCLAFTSAEGPRCHRMCPSHSVRACDPGSECIGTFGDACIDVCRPVPAPCDIYQQNCASSTDTCTLVRDLETNAPYTGCRPAGTIAEGMPCGGAAGTCGHALICVGTAGVATCRHVCDPSAAPDPCTAPATCGGLAMTWGVHFCQAP